MSLNKQPSDPARLLGGRADRTPKISHSMALGPESYPCRAFYNMQTPLVRYRLCRRTLVPLNEIALGLDSKTISKPSEEILML